MQRISGADAIANRFNDNPTVQSPTTRVPAAWLNDVQETLIAPIEAAGLTLDPGNGGQLLQAIEVLLDQVQPIGSVLQLDGPNESVRLCEVNTEYLRADYPRLVAYYIAQSRLIEGSTGAHFRTPNYEGRFARAASTNNAVDPDGPRSPGSMQLDAFASHTHTIAPPSSNSEASAGNTVTGLSGSSETLNPYSSQATGSAETRPRNAVLRWAIRGR